jgi:hypothetical protein
MEDYEIREAYNRRREVPSLVNIDIEINRRIAELVISNYGNAIAQDIRFKFSEGMMWLEEIKPTNVIEKGISKLPPGKTLRFAYNVGPKLFEASDDRAKRFEVNADYFHPALGQRVNENFSFDLNDFKHTLANQSDIERLTQELVREIKSLTGEVKKLDGRLEKIAQIASATGLNLSMSTIENLRHIVERTGEVEKIYPLHCTPQVFMDVLKVPFEMGLRFAAYFRGSGKAESISQIEGATQEILERFNHYFVWVEVSKPPPNNLFSVSVNPPKPSES